MQVLKSPSTPTTIEGAHGPVTRTHNPIEALKQFTLSTTPQPSSWRLTCFAWDVAISNEPATSRCCLQNYLGGMVVSCSWQQTGSGTVKQTVLSGIIIAAVVGGGVQAGPGVKCPIDHVSDAVEDGLRTASTCKAAVDLFWACGTGGGRDASRLQIVSEKCEPDYARAKPLRRAAEREVGTCWKKAARDIGTEGSAYLAGRHIARPASTTAIREGLSEARGSVLTDGARPSRLLASGGFAVNKPTPHSAGSQAKLCGLARTGTAVPVQFPKTRSRETIHASSTCRQPASSSGLNLARCCA